MKRTNGQADSWPSAQLYNVIVEDKLVHNLQRVVHILSANLPYQIGDDLAMWNFPFTYVPYLILNNDAQRWFGIFWLHAHNKQPSLYTTRD